jgi:hypothetical protein
MHNYTLSDFSGALLALGLFPVFLFAPGYVAGWAFNFCAFREKDLTERCLLSVPLSVSITPIAASIMVRFVSLSHAILIFVALTTVFAGGLIYEARNRGNGLRIQWDRTTKFVSLGMAAWAILAIVLLIDIQVGERLYLSTSVFDHCIRTAFSRSILKNGMPPVNPLFSPGGHTIPLRYYYYWYLVCALPAKMLGIDPRLAIYASCAWSGFALAAMVPLYLKYFMGHCGQLRRKSSLGIALFLVTGLDLLPTIVYLLSPGHTVFPDMEWWDAAVVGSWVSSFLWVPHHIAALVACLMGFLLLWNVAPTARFGERAKASIIAALAFASAGGLSAYVSFTFGAFLIVWGVFVLIQRRWTELAMLAVAGVVAVLVSLPYLHDLQMNGASGQFAVWALRWHSGDSLEMVGIHSTLARNIGSILEMPLMYLLELGFFFVVGAVRLWNTVAQRKALSRFEIALWMMLGVSLFIASFLRSSVITANDLGIRSALLMQFVLLLWAAPLVYEWSTTHGESLKGVLRSLVKPWTLRLLLILGIAATAYQVTLMRAYSFIHDNRAGSPDYRVPSKDLAGTAYAIRTAFKVIDKTLPETAIVQADPWSHIYFPYPLYASRRAITSIPGCGTAFSGTAYERDCYLYQLAIGKAFNYPEWLATKYVDSYCDRYSIDVLLVTSNDPIWKARESWAWQRPTLMANEWVRVIGCGSRIQH